MSKIGIITISAFVAFIIFDQWRGSKVDYKKQRRSLVQSAIFLSLVHIAVCSFLLVGSGFWIFFVVAFILSLSLLGAFFIKEEMRLHYLQYHTDRKPSFFDHFKTIKDDVVMLYPHSKIKKIYFSCIWVNVAGIIWFIIMAIIDSNTY